MGNRQIIKRVSQRWVAIVCLGSLGWLGLAVPKLPGQAQPQQPQQPQQLCMDETRFQALDVVTTRASWGHTALGAGQIQPAAAHFAEALDFVATIDQVRVRALILEELIRDNSSSSDWLIHDVDRLIELGETAAETAAIRTVLRAAQRATQGLPRGYSTLKIRLLVTIALDYAAMGDQTTALGLLDQARQAVPHVQGAEFKAIALIAIAQGYGAVDDQGMATEVATQALQQAEAVTDGDGRRRDQTVEAIAMVYAEAGDIDQALQLAQSIEQPYARETVIGRAALAAAQLGQLERAADLVQRLTLEQPTVRTMTEIGLHLANSGHGDLAKPYFDQAMGVIATDGYPGPSFTQPMIHAGLTATLLETLALAPEGRIKVTGLMDVASHYVSVNNVTVNNNAAARDVLQRALVATENVEQPYDQRELWEDILQRAMALEDYELALSTVETLVARELIFNENSNYTTIAGAAARSGKIDFALMVTDRIDPSYLSNRHWAWGEIAGAYAVAGDFEAAFAMAERTRSSAGTYARALGSIGLQQRQAGLWDESVQTIDRAVQVAEGLADSSIHLGLEALNFIVLAQVKAGQPEPELFGRVLAMVGDIAADPDGSFTLQAVVTDWVEAGEYGLALRLFDAIANVNPENPLWKTILVERLMAAADYATALDIIESRDVSHLEVDEMLQIAERYIQVGQRDQAVRMAL